jgi:hypothetical protein
VRQMYRWLVDEQLSSYAIQKRLIERAIATRKESGRGWSQSVAGHRVRSSASYPARPTKVKLGIIGAAWQTGAIPT